MANQQAQQVQEQDFEDGVIEIPNGGGGIPGIGLPVGNRMSGGGNMPKGGPMRGNGGFNPMPETPRRQPQMQASTPQWSDNHLGSSSSWTLHIPKFGVHLPGGEGHNYPRLHLPLSVTGLVLGGLLYIADVTFNMLGFGYFFGDITEKTFTKVPVFNWTSLGIGLLMAVVVSWAVGAGVINQVNGKPIDDRLHLLFGIAACYSVGTNFIGLMSQVFTNSNALGADWAWVMIGLRLGVAILCSFLLSFGAIIIWGFSTHSKNVGQAGGGRR